MKKENNWQLVDLEAQGFKSNNGTKPYIKGSGPFVDNDGSSSLSGNALIRNWWSLSNLFSIIFAVFWNVFLYFFIKSSWNNPVTVNKVKYLSLQHAYQDNQIDIFFMIFPLLGIWLAFWLAYRSICYIVNKTTISLESGQLQITKGPLPWGVKKSPVPSSAITQIYVQQYSTHSRDRVPVISFRVMAHVMNQEDICIDDGFSNYSAARILEQWLESKLKIEDNIIPGEA